EHRTPTRRPPTSAEDHLADLVAGLAFGRGNEWAATVLERSVEALPESATELAGYVWNALEFIHVDRVDIPDLAEPAQRAVGWLTNVIGPAADALRELAAGGDSEESVRDLFQVIDTIISRIYFHSGIYQGDGR